MVAPTQEEIAAMLVRLNYFSRDFDVQEARWKVTHGEQAAYESMMQAERDYVALSEWLWSQGIAVFWDRTKQEYTTCHEFVTMI